MRFLPFILTAITLLMPADSRAVSADAAEIVFEGPGAQALTLTNDTELMRTYNIEWAGQAPDKMLHFAPRHIAIAPDESRQIYLLFRKPANLKDGEYQYSLQVTPQPSQGKFSIVAADKIPAASQASNDEKRIVLPVIIRNVPTAPADEELPAAPEKPKSEKEEKPVPAVEVKSP